MLHILADSLMIASRIEDRNTREHNKVVKDYQAHQMHMKKLETPQRSALLSQLRNAKQRVFW